MKWFAMWHPELGWGPMGVPILMARKQNAARGTGLSLKKMRDLGWRWKVFIALNDGMIPKLKRLADELSQSVNGELRDVATEIREIIDEDGTSGDERNGDQQVDEEYRGDAD